MKEQISLKIQTNRDTLTVKFDICEGKMHYIVWDRCCGRGYPTLSAAMSYIQKEYGNYKLISIDALETNNYSFTSNFESKTN